MDRSKTTGSLDTFIESMIISLVIRESIDYTLARNDADTFGLRQIGQ